MATAPARKQAPKAEEESPAAPTHVNFVPSTHTTGTNTVSGATFAFAPGVAVVVTAADAEDLVSQGLGYIEGA